MRLADLRSRLSLLVHTAVEGAPSSTFLDIGDRMTVGEGTYGRPRTRWYQGDPETTVTIGSWCSIAEGVEIVTGGGHPVDRVTTFPLRAHFGLPGAFADGHPTSRGDVVIGSDVWLARGAKVLSGVTIGHGAVVAAYAVVSSDVPPYTIVGGSPARELRKRFDDATIERLLATRWWERGEAWVRAHVDELAGTDIEAFLAAAEADRA